MLGNVTGSEYFSLIPNLSDENYVAFSFVDLEAFLSLHGLTKGSIPGFIRQFNFPGRRIMKLFSGPRDQLVEAIEIVAKWGKDYNPLKVGRFVKKERMEEMKRDLALSRAGEYKIKKRWDPLGGQGIPI